MSENLTQQIANKLMYIAFSNTDIPFEEIVHNHISNVGPSYTLCQKDVDCIKQIGEDLIQIDSKNKKISYKFLQDMIMESVLYLMTLKRSEAAEKSFSKAEKIIDKVSTGWKLYTVMTPMNNLQSEVDNFTIGNVEFCNVKLNSLDVVENLPQDSGTRNRIQRFDNHFSAKTTIEAQDSEKAKELGIAQIELAINVLRFYGLAAYGSQKDFLRNMFCSLVSSFRNRKIYWTNP